MYDGEGEHDMINVVVLQIERPPKEIVKALRERSVATIHEEMGKAGLMSASIKSLFPGTKMAGPALTVRCALGDNLMLHRGLSLAQPGDVLVVDAQSAEVITWGELATISARALGVAGVVTNGSVRDLPGLRKMETFPIFYRTVSAAGASKSKAGSVNVPVAVGGIVVRPGDIIVGDDDGVVVVPPEDAKEVIARALEREARERELAKALAEGKHTYYIRGYDKALAATGVKEIQGPIRYWHDLKRDDQLERAF